MKLVSLKNIDIWPSCKAVKGLVFQLKNHKLSTGIMVGLRFHTLYIFLKVSKIPIIPYKGIRFLVITQPFFDQLG